MVRRAIITLALGVFALGTVAQAASAETLPLIKHRTKVNVTDVSFVGQDMVVTGDLDSGYRPCVQRRLVGLFLNGNQVAITRTNKNGDFTLTAPDVPGTYEVIAFKHARDCNHLCRIGRAEFSTNVG